jgi:hypothetical protein
MMMEQTKALGSSLRQTHTLMAQLTRLCHAGAERSKKK